MRLLFLHLENYINIYNGLGKKVIDIDFSKCNNRLLVLLGENGTGKSSIFNTLNPFIDDSSVFIPDKEVKKSITYALNDGTNLTISYSAYRGVKTRSKPSRCSIIRQYPTGESYELNENGNITSGKEIIFKLLDLNDDYITLSSISATNKGLGDLTPRERKRYVGNIMSAIGDYVKLNKLFIEKSTVIKSLLKSLSVKLSQIGSVELIQDSAIKNKQALADLKVKEKDLISNIARLEAKIENITVNEVNPLQELNSLIDKRKELEKNIQGIPEEYINKYTEEYMIEITEKNAKLSSQYELLDSQINDLLDKENKYRSSITSNEIKLNALFDENVLNQVKSSIEDINNKIVFYESRFNSIGFTEYESITESEYNMTLISISRYNSIIEYIGDNFSEDIRTRAVSNEIDNKDYDSIRSKLKEQLEDFTINGTNQTKYREISKKFNLVPENCNNIDSCPFIKDIVDAKKLLVSDKEFDNIISSINEINESLDKLDKMQEESRLVIDCREKYKDLISIIQSVQSTLSKFTSKISIKNIEYDVVNLVKIDIDVSKYQEYSNYISAIKSSKEDLDRYKKELDKIMSSSKESVALKTIINKEKEDLQELLDSKVTLVERIGKIKEEYIRIKEAYNNISAAKAYKEQYNQYSTQLKEIQNKIDSLIENAKEYKSISSELSDYKIQLNSLSSNDIPRLQNEIEKANYQMVLYNQYKEDYSQYEQLADKINMFKKYSGINGIQTVYMEVFMNSILQDANQLLSLLFRGRFKLQPFVINENEFVIPCIDDNGNIRPDISLMSDSQLSEISMIISFVLLHKASDKYNIIRLDEVDDNLDNRNRLQFVILINRIMDILNFEQCIMISHNNELDLSNSDVIITKIEDSEHRRSILNSGANIIADFD